MIILKKGLAAIAITLALSALALPSYAQGRGVEISPKCAQAIHACVLASRYPQYLWGNMEIFHYRACMTRTWPAGMRLGARSRLARTQQGGSTDSKDDQAGARRAAHMRTARG
jgi:hypothetical protein